MLWGRKAVFLGDDTWMNLFPSCFHRAHPFPSFNVKDLHTVDDGIIRHLYDEVARDDWDIIIAHFLGVDHVGHRLGPLHPAMADKLNQMNDVLGRLLAVLPPETLLLFMGDHGMTETGDHGGESESEVSAALFVYSTEPLFSKTLDSEPRRLYQVDLVPSLTLLLGLPIPYSNLGAVIPELFGWQGFQAMPTNPQEYLRPLEALHLNALQVSRFVTTYAAQHREFSAEILLKLNQTLLEAQALYRSTLSAIGSWNSTSEANVAIAAYQRYLYNVRKMCEAGWASFNIPMMVAGICTISVACLWSALLAWGGQQHSYVFYSNLSKVFLEFGISGAVGVTFLSALFGTALRDLPFHAACGLTLSSGILLGYKAFYLSWPFLVGSMDWTICGVNGVVSAMAGPALWLVRCLSLFSNSFILLEGQLVGFLFQSSLILIVLDTAHACLPSTALSAPQKHRALRVVVSVASAALACTRIAAMFRICREELPTCQPSSLLVPLLSGSDRTLHYGAAIISTTVICWTIRRFLALHGTFKAFASPPMLLVRYGFPIVAVCLGAHWGLELMAGERQAATMPHWVADIFPRVIFVLLGGGMLLTLWKPLALYTLRRKDFSEDLLTSHAATFAASQDRIREVVPQIYRFLKRDLSRSLKANHNGVQMEESSSETKVEVYGLGAPYSVVLLVFVGILIMLTAMLHTPGTTPAFLLLFASMAALLELVAALSAALPDSSDTRTVPLLSVVAWTLASTRFFYSTGHQPTFPALQWNAAFVGFHGDHSTNLLPGLLVIMNTFSSQAIFAVGLPLLLTWPFVRGVWDGDWLTVGRKGQTINRLVNKQRESEPKMEMGLRDQPGGLGVALLHLAATFLLLQGLQLLACMLAAAWLRRHLMVWGIFAPRFLFEATGFMVSSFWLLLSIALVLHTDTRLTAWLQHLNSRFPR
uniref:Phosphatidylinositol glycan anchor biosynthesis, class O n=2 Tax=Eptatretus burgeri TaxID=7764 RepID=A0A8C4WWZ3_EPTBU